MHEESPISMARLVSGRGVVRYCTAQRRSQNYTPAWAQAGASGITGGGAGGGRTRGQRQGANAGRGTTFERVSSELLLAYAMILSRYS